MSIFTPSLIIVEPLYDDDKNFIPPGYYELALNDEQNFMLLIQSKNPVAIIPVFKVEVDANEPARLNDKKYKKYIGQYAFFTDMPFSIFRFLFYWPYKVYKITV